VSPMVKQIHAWLAWAFVGAILIQVFLAGLAIPQLGGNGSFETHLEFGYTMGFVALALVIAAVAARLGRRRILQALGLLVLYIVQTILPNLDPGLSVAAALHPLNAMILFVLSIWYARQVWRERSAATA
jgi:mercuric ion transport protein